MTPGNPRQHGAWQWTWRPRVAEAEPEAACASAAPCNMREEPLFPEKGMGVS